MKSRCSPVVLSSASVLSAVAGAAASDLTLRTVVLSGDPAPGLPGLTFEWFSDPRIAPAAAPGAPVKLAFWADLAGTGVTEASNGSIWSDRAGSLAILYRENDAAPVTGDIRFGAIPSPAFAADGSLAFTASLTDPLQPSLPTNLALFAEGTGGLALRAREGEQAPGFPTGTNYYNLPIANFAAGALAFHANNGAAIWYSTPTGTSPRVRAGAVAPGGATTIYYGALANPILQPDGGFAFAATTFPNATQTGQPTGNGIWHALALASASPIAVSGSQASSTGLFFNDLSANPVPLPSFGTTTRVVYWSSVTGSGVTTLNDAALFAPSSISPAVVRAREGDGAPGVGPGVFFGVLSRQPAADAPSATTYFLAFRASIVGEGVSNLNNSGIWLARQTGAPVLVAREGDQVPRLPAGTLYASFSDPIVNSAGQVAFLARLRGAGVTPATSLVLMMTERASTTAAPAGRVAPIVRTGDSFAVAPGDHRVVDEIIADMGQAGAGFESLADSGVLFFKLGFKDPIVPPPPPPQLAFTFTQGLFTATVRCLADVNADGALNVADFGAYQTAFVLADLRKCDFNGDGVLTVADFGSFQTAFVQACP